jgi:hypothetical protein
MSNLSHTIRRFNRFELKYIITLRQAEQFKKALRAYLVPDEHGSGSYTLDSLYYDSPDYRFFWEKMDGVKFRCKLRIRRYDNGQPLTDDAPVFLEIKQRLDRVTQKRRVLLPYRDALRFCNRRERPDCDPQDAPVLEEIEAMLWQYNLRPVSVVHYQRQALIGTDYDIGLRVTFDTALGYRTGNLNLHEEPSNLPMFPPDRVVMEIKVNERIPYWLTELVAIYNLQLVRVSKYCRSIELAQKSPSARWLMGAI